jgi:hypothetical protein
VPKCNYKADLKLDLERVLWVDMDKLSIDHKKHMLKRGSKSVTSEEVKHYQETLEANNPDTIKITLEDDTSVIIKIKHPSLNYYMNVGEYFIQNLADKISTLIQNKKIIEEPEQAEVLILDAIYLNLFLHYVESISVDGSVMEDIVDIEDTLSLLSENPKYRDIVKSKIAEYIDNGLVSIVGIPDWVCPVCKESQSEADNNFRSFIPLAVLEYFFIQLGVQYTRILEELKEI